LGTAASFYDPHDVVLDSSGWCYEHQNTNESLSSIASTLAGSSSASYFDGIGIEASFNVVSLSVAFDTNGIRITTESNDYAVQYPQLRVHHQLLLERIPL
jgi:hypothetical protein